MENKKFFLTTAIPYVNAKPHLGHALEYIQADAVHRYRELLGGRVYFVSGADENAVKNVLAAEQQGIPVWKFLQTHSEVFRLFYRKLDVKLDAFRRGTDRKHHWPGVQELWRRCDATGDIYTKRYSGLYCIGCESFKTHKDLVRGKCPDHDTTPELIEEENYFFRLSNYRDRLQRLIVSDSLRIIPEKRKREVLAFIRGGLDDFSISRNNKRARGVGVPVPGDRSQKVYVWFDALSIYMTGIGYGYNERLWKKWWPADLHVIGKDIIRFHAVYWPAMLLSARLALPKQLLVHGFITSGGQKMSKTIGNVVDPYDVLKRYGLEATRYYLLREIPTLDDGDFTYRRFEELYAADLANGLGNTVARVAKLCETSGFDFDPDTPPGFSSEIRRQIEAYRLDLALGEIWKKISDVDASIERQRPWDLSGKKLRSVLTDLVAQLRQIGYDLQPFLPGTAAAILEQFSGPKIISSRPLFPRLP